MWAPVTLGCNDRGGNGEGWKRMAGDAAGRGVDAGVDEEGLAMGWREG